MPGYSFLFVEQLAKTCYCPACGLPMRDPVLVKTCGHRFCDTCVQEFLSGGVFKCPEDDKPLDYTKLYPDKAVQTEIMSSLVRCTYQTEGCQWMDSLFNLPSHLLSCRFDSVPCPNKCPAKLTRVNLDDHLEYLCPKRKVVCDFCHQAFTGDYMDQTHAGNCPKEVLWCENKCGTKTERKFLANHMKNECYKRTVICQFCSREFLFETLQTHQYQCPRYLVGCPNRCDPTKIPREDMENHVQDLCPSATVCCPFKNAGCQHKCPRYSLDIHLEDSMKVHLGLTCDLVKQQQTQITQLCAALHTITQTTDGVFIWRISNYKAKLMDAMFSNDKELKSPAFYTSKFGYKACLSVFLNGNGSAEGKYLSLYIRLLQGDYDNILSWPFLLPVSFTLYDQCADADMRANLCETFQSEASCSHFQKPVKYVETLGFGYPKFVCHEIMKTRDYVRDDSLVIRVSVDNSTFIKP